MSPSLLDPVKKENKSVLHKDVNPILIRRQQPGKASFPEMVFEYN
jgi:hypothetical protein